jgi:kynurenine formamidase
VGRNPDGSWTPPTYRVHRVVKLNDNPHDRVPSNWGRWGRFDEIGTANFITPERIAGAAKLIRSGRALSLEIPLDHTGPVHPARKGGIVHLFSWTGADAVVGGQLTSSAPGGFQSADDYIFMPLQGSTQWDGLAHLAFEDALFNGFWAGNTEAFAGARRLSISNMKDRLTGRGVLLDVAGYLGVTRVEPGRPITADELDACASAQGVQVRTGDLLLVRTGHLGWWYELDAETKSEFWKAAPGLSMHAADWLYEHEVAALAVDNGAVEVEPFEDPYTTEYPLHVRLIRDLGLTLGEVWWLDDLAAACRAEERWEFFLCAAPLNVTNGVGSPVNPIAYL